MTRAPLWLAAFLVVMPACEDSTPVARGFASRQVTQLRERTLRFQGARGDLVLYSTVAADATHYWSVDIRTGAVREHDEMFTDVPVPQYTFPADPNARFHCSFGSDAMGRSQLQIDDAQTGQRTTIDGVHDNGGCPSESDPTIKLWRRDGSDHLTLWSGRYDDVQMVPIDLTVVGLIQDFRMTDASVIMIASPTAQPDAVGLYEIDLASFAVTELVPPVLQGGAWADGATPLGSLDSGSVFRDRDQYGWGVVRVADHLRYWRAIAGDGGVTMFVGPLAAGPARELALFHHDGSAHQLVSVAPADGKYPPQTPVPPVWRHWAGADPSEIIVWDDGRQRLLTCPTDFTYGAKGSLNPDGSKLALFTAQSPNLPAGATALAGPLLLVDLANPAGGAAPCTVLAAANVSLAAFSPDGSALMWLVQPDLGTYGDTELWLAAGDGSAPRLVGVDGISGPPGEPRFTAGGQLDLFIDGDLLWIDTHDDPIRTHPIAEQVIGPVIDRGRWLILGYEASVQDGTARLGIVDRQTGNQRLISPDVVTFMSPDIANGYNNVYAPNRGADEPIRIVYQVRGRNPSSQDGLWVATINQSDIPDRMIAARLAAVVVVLAASARAAAALDGGAGADGGSVPGDARDDAAGDGVARDGHDGGGDVSAARGDAAADAASDAPSAPTVPLRGRVLQKGTRRPLPGAAVTVDGVASGESGADGGFELRVAPGRHRVQIQTPGHDTADQTVEAGAVATDAVVLFRLALRLTGERYETTVRTLHPEIQQIDVSGEEARAVAGTMGDPLKVIGSLPGVQQIVWPAAVYVVRGANPGNTGFYLDGVRVPALFHIALGPSVIHPYLIGGVDFYPGAYPATFGGFVSGIMAARTTAPPADRVHASADVTVYDAGGIMTAPWNRGRGTVAVAARYSYTGALFSLLAADSTLRYGDYQLRVDHPLAGGQATVFAFGALDELGWRNLNVPEYASLQFHRIDMRWRRALGGGRLLAATTIGADWSRSTLFDRPIRARGLSVAPRLYYDRTLGIVDVLLGADAIAQDFDTAVPDFGRRPSDLGRSRQALTVGAHATVTLHAGPRLNIAPGIRGDFFAEQGVRRSIAQPRLDVALQATDRLTLRANGGRFAQMPSLPVSVAGFEAFGLADLGLQTSLAGSVGFEARLPRSLTVTLTGYAAQLRLTDVRDIDLTSIDPGAPDFLVSRRGRAYGAELLVRRADVGRLYGWLAYTLSWSRRQDESGVFGPSDWDQRHILNLVAGYRLPRGYAVGARVHYNTGRRAPVIGSDGGYQNLPAFYTLDLRVERRIIFDRFVMAVYADFANVTLTREVVQVVRNYDANGDPYAEERSFRLILPTIGVRAEI